MTPIVRFMEGCGRLLFVVGCAGGVLFLCYAMVMMIKMAGGGPEPWTLYWTFALVFGTVLRHTQSILDWFRSFNPNAGAVRGAGKDFVRYVKGSG